MAAGKRIYGQRGLLIVGYTGARISTEEDIRRVMEGARVYSLQIGEQDSPTGFKNHGDYKEACRSCSRILPLIGVTAHT